MAELRGLPVIYNAKNITITGIVTSVLGKNLSMDFTRDADFAGFKDDEGDTMSEVITDKKKSLSLRIVPYNSTLRATAVTNMYAMLPDPGTAVVVADDEAGSVIDDLFTGNYSVRSAKLGRTSEGIATIDLELMQFEKIDITNGPIT